MSRKMVAFPLLLSVALVLASCSASAGEATVVDVELTDTQIIPAPTSAPAGTVEFMIRNGGTTIHEFEIFESPQTDIELPIVSNIADTADLTLVDEVEDIPPGATVRLAVPLSPGRYLLICNLPGHYAAGMHVEFQVEG